MILGALENYLPPLVEEMEASIHAFLAGGVRGDGHYKLPQRVKKTQRTAITFPPQTT